MKTRNFAALISLCCFVTAYAITLNKNENNLDGFLIENIEALTSEENVSGMIECYENGGIYCPINKKSDYKIVVIYQ